MSPPGLEGIGSMVHFLSIAAIGLCCLLAAVKFLTARSTEDRVAAGALGLGGLVLFAVVSVAVPTLVADGSSSSSAAASATPTPAPSLPSPPAPSSSLAPAAPSVPASLPAIAPSVPRDPSMPAHQVRVPWATVALAAAGLLAVATAAVLVLLVVRAVARRRRAAAVRTRQLSLLQGRHDRAYGEAQYARDLLGDRPDGPDGQDPALERYAAAVRELEGSWAVAIAYARRVGHALLPADERRRLQRAVALLRKALYDGAPEAERQACYRQAMRLVENLVVVPRRAVLAVERSHRLALPAPVPPVPAKGAGSVGAR